MTDNKTTSQKILDLQMLISEHNRKNTDPLEQESLLKLHEDARMLYWQAVALETKFSGLWGRFDAITQK